VKGADIVRASVITYSNASASTPTMSMEAVGTVGSMPGEGLVVELADGLRHTLAPREAPIVRGVPVQEFSRSDIESHLVVLPATCAKVSNRCSETHAAGCGTDLR
jgi:hypothetical protein